jgi:hypothetical protein
MDEGTILVYCCPSIFSLTCPPSQSNVYSIYRQFVAVGGGGGGWEWGGYEVCDVDHMLHEFNTLFLTRFRTYKIGSPFQTKMTSKDDMKGLVSLKFLRP